MTAANLRIRVLIFRDPESDLWFAQGLEHDICAQAETIDRVHAAFEQAVLAEAAVANERGSSLADIPEAPAKFFRAYRDATVQTGFARRSPSSSSRSSAVKRLPEPEFRMVDRLAANA